MSAASTETSRFEQAQKAAAILVLTCVSLVASAPAGARKAPPLFSPPQFEYTFPWNGFLNADAPYINETVALDIIKDAYLQSWGCAAAATPGVYGYAGYAEGEGPIAYLSLAETNVTVSGSTNPPNCNNNLGNGSEVLRKSRAVASCPPGLDGPFEWSPGGPFYVCHDDEKYYYDNPLTMDCPPTEGNPCELTTGIKIERAVDYSGPGIEFYRTFRSNIYALEADQPGIYGQILGKNWSHNYESRLIFDGTTPTRWVNSDGAIVAFYQIEPDVYIAENGSGVQLHPTNPADPNTEWEIFYPSGRKETYKWYCYGSPLCYAGYYLKEAHDALGNVTRVNYSGSERALSVTGPYGHSLQFAYSAIAGYGTVTRSMDYLLDPAGEKIDFIHIETDPSLPGGNLLGAKYQDSARLTYRYDTNTGPGYFSYSDFFVRGIIDENGDEFATFEYYDLDPIHFSDLRVKSTRHGAYEYTGFEYAYTGESTIVTDADGNETEYVFRATPELNPYDWEPDWAARSPETITGQDGYASSQENEPSGQRRVTQLRDENGVVTKFEYDNYHLISKKEGLNDKGDSDPGNDEWARETTYQYLNQTSDLKTRVREPSAACPGQFRDTVTTYVSGTQWVETVTVIGYDPDDCATPISRTITYSNFNMYGQPERIDGPRVNPNDAADTEWDATDVHYYVTNESGGSCATSGGGRCGQLKSITNALGHTTTFDLYDAHGRLTRSTDPNGLVTTYNYTPRGLVDWIRQDDGVNPIRTVDYTYDAAKQIDSISFPEGVSLDLEWNEAHLLESVADAAGNRIEYGYDARGNRTSENFRGSSTGPIERALTLSYDARNRLEWVQQGNSNKAYVNFDAVGNLDDTKDPNSNTLVFGDIVTDYKHDSLNRLDEIVDALNGPANSTDYDYDVHDNLTIVKAPNGATTAYVYDDLGNLLQEFSPDRGDTLYGYDAAGNMTCKADGRYVSGQANCESVPGRWIYTYDAIGRVQSVDYTNVFSAGPEVVYAYDGAGEKGRLDSVTQWNQGAIIRTEYDYDLYGNLVAQRQDVPGNPEYPAEYTTAYKYDGNDRVIEIAYPSGRTVTYQRDMTGRIAQIKTKGPEDSEDTTVVSTVLYKPFGPPRLIVFDNGLKSSRTFDTAYRVRTNDLVDGFDSVDSHVFTLDDAGNVKQDLDVWDPPNSGDYTYDELHRLIDDTKVETAAANTYAYDANGNRTSRVESLPNFPGQDIAYLPNCNKISTFNGSPIQYDGAGNPVDDYIYNAANRLTRIDWNAESMSLIYNGAGELVRTRRQPGCDSCGNCPPAIRHYYHFAADGRALGMVDISVGNNPVERDWIWLDGIPVAQIQESYLSNGTHLGTQITYLHTDHLGTPRFGTDENGDATWVYQSDAFGKSLAYNADVTMPLRMPGQIDYSFGPEGLYYNYYRDYDSNTGRYLESDPIGLVGGLNTYGYVGQNPTRWADPTGLTQWRGWSTGFSLSYAFGWTWYSYELTSECGVDGRQATATVIATGPTIGAGIGLASGGFGTLNIRDNRTFVDPFVFNGKFALRSVAASAAGIGAAAWVLELGGSHTALHPDSARSEDAGIFLGMDFGINATQGTSTLVDVEWRACSCPN